MIKTRRYPFYRNSDSTFIPWFVPLIPLTPPSAGESVLTATVSTWGCVPTLTGAGNFGCGLRTGMILNTQLIQGGETFVAQSGTGSPTTVDRLMVATGTSDATVAAALNAATKLSLITTATEGPTPDLSLITMGMDLWLATDEPDFTATTPVTLESNVLLRWPNASANESVFTPDTLPAVNVVTITRADKGKQAALLEQLIERDLADVDELIAAPGTAGYCQLQLIDLTCTTVQRADFGRPNPEDVWQLGVYALINSQTGVPSDLDGPTGLAFPVNSLQPTFRWVFTGAFLFIPGGWTRLGRDWTATDSDALTPGPTCTLTNSELNSHEIASAIARIPNGAVALGIKSWNNRAYTGGVPPVLALLKLAVW